MEERYRCPTYHLGRPGRLVQRERPAKVVTRTVTHELVRFLGIGLTLHQLERDAPREALGLAQAVAGLLGALPHKVFCHGHVIQPDAVVALRLHALALLGELERPIIDASAVLVQVGPKLGAEHRRELGAR